MNILITSIIDLEKTSYSRLHHFIDHLILKGHDITVISIKDTWKHKGVKQNQELVSKIRIIHLPQKPILQQKRWAMFHSGKIFSQMDLDRIDIHLSYNSIVLSYLIARKLRKRGIPTVYDLADDLPEMIGTSQQIPPMLRGFAGLFSKVMLRRNLRMAKTVMISAKEFQKSMGISKYPHVYVPNGVDLTNFGPDKKRKPGKDEPVVVGYLGALREWVDLRPMLIAIKNLSAKGYKVRALIVGGEDDLEQYRNFVAQHLITDVVFTGNVPYAEVPGWINRMDITTIPFRKNRVTDGTCPLKLLEYMACEKPVISSRLSEVRTMLADNVIYADSVDEWEKGIKSLCDDPMLRQKMGIRGRKLVMKNFNWKDICTRMEDVLLRHAKKTTGQTKQKTPLI